MARQLHAQIAAADCQLDVYRVVEVHMYDPCACTRAHCALIMPTCSWLFHGCQIATAADPIIVALVALPRLDVVPERADCAAHGGTRARIARWLVVQP